MVEPQKSIRIKGESAPGKLNTTWLYGHGGVVPGRLPPAIVHGQWTDTLGNAACGMKELTAPERAVVALYKASAERGGPTGATVPEYFALLSGQSMSPSGKELLLVHTKPNEISPSGIS